MKNILIIGLLISSLFCYLEWADQSTFLWEVEWMLLSGKASEGSLAHPFILVPLLGQLLLIASLFIKKSPFRLVFIGMAFIWLLAGMILLVGFLSLHTKILLSVLPYLLFSIASIVYYRKAKKAVIQK